VGVTAGGTAVAEAKSTFHTLADPMKSLISHPLGGPARLYAFTHDDNGELTRRVATEPGADGKLGTDDDVIVSWHEYIYQADREVDVFYNGPGADKKWFTADDDVWWYDVWIGGVAHRSEEPRLLAH